MTRYYNENPQVAIWKDQAFKNQQLMIAYKNSRDQEKRINQILIDKMNEFNSLPWYKKLFYKFRV